MFESYKVVATIKAAVVHTLTGQQRRVISPIPARTPLSKRDKLNPRLRRNRFTTRLDATIQGYAISASSRS